LLFAYSDSTEGRIQRADLLVRRVVRVQHLPGQFIPVNITPASPGPPAGCTRVVFSVSDSMAQLTNQGFTAAVLAAAGYDVAAPPTSPAGWIPSAHPRRVVVAAECLGKHPRSTLHRSTLLIGNRHLVVAHVLPPAADPHLHLLPCKWYAGGWCFANRLLPAPAPSAGATAPQSTSLAQRPPAASPVPLPQPQPPQPQQQQQQPPQQHSSSLRPQPAPPLPNPGPQVRAPDTPAGSARSQGGAPAPTSHLVGRADVELAAPALAHGEQSQRPSVLPSPAPVRSRLQAPPGQAAASAQASASTPGALDNPVAPTPTPLPPPPPTPPATPSLLQQHNSALRRQSATPLPNPGP
jgi:hypothetical protein